jgi:hypothetical protein
VFLHGEEKQKKISGGASISVSTLKSKLTIINFGVKFGFSTSQFDVIIVLGSGYTSKQPKKIS